ncbi:MULTISPECIES: dihydropteroate synthase [Xanthobacter]|uniref:dihydropteroate synthase n=1 Tax=Xanthobacter TaxID=279 RepID=UPI001AE6EBB8|nr:dihydropteroate synthase [Xanthobacter flavus]MBP2148804.1 dihydropteroate synthase [Xanthobacter flavus]
MPAAPSRSLLARGHALHLGPRTLIMGILNVTPDSFSDGGRSAAPDDALANARRLVAEGADMLDVGGESTRPGHTPVAAEDEWARIAPVIPALVAEMGVPVSVDTYKAEVARRALEAGASIVNDVWGFTRDPDMAKVVADHDAAAVVMHNRAEVDETLDIVTEMLGFFERVLEIADRAGVKREKLVLDPGIGFGKSFPQNLAAIRRLPELRVLGLPILLGTSRKSLIGKVIQTTPAERVPGTIASNVIAIMDGVEIIRVHDVAAHVQAARVAEAIRDAS